MSEVDIQKKLRLLTLRLIGLIEKLEPYSPVPLEAIDPIQEVIAEISSQLEEAKTLRHAPHKKAPHRK